MQTDNDKNVEPGTPRRHSCPPSRSGGDLREIKVDRRIGNHRSAGDFSRRTSCNSNVAGPTIEQHSHGSGAIASLPGAREAKSPPQQMEAVLQALSEDLGQIALAVRDGKITPEQAEYLSIE